MATKSNNHCISWPTERSFLVDILSLGFGLGAWVSVTGFWVELPLLIADLPEGWSISSQLSVAIQLANIGPIMCAIFAWFRKGKSGTNKENDQGLSLDSRRYVTYCLLLLGIIANILLAFEWNATAMISGYLHSVALIALMFSVGLIGCTSPVLFMPLMAIFPKVHLVSYLVGEGLGGFLPSMVALIQGVRESTKDSNSTTPDLYLDWKNSLPRFNPTVYFLFIAALMLLSTVSFYLLNNLSATKKVMIHSQQILNPEVIQDNVFLSTNADDIEDCSFEREISSDVSVIRFGGNIVRGRKINSDGQGDEIEHVLSHKQGQTKGTRSPIIRQLLHILIVQGWICFFSSGFLPGVSTFSCLPYGDQAYHLSATLGAAIVPIACSFAFLSKHPPHIACISGVTVLASMLSVYTILTAAYSPTPPLVGTTIGEVLIVLDMVLYGGLSTYVKVNVAGVCRELESSLSEENGTEEGSGRGPLFWCGAVSQATGAIGAVIAFILVTVLGIFKSQ